MGKLERRGELWGWGGGGRQKTEGGCVEGIPGGSVCGWGCATGLHGLTATDAAAVKRVALFFPRPARQKTVLGSVRVKSHC